MDQFFEVTVKVKYPIDHDSYQSNTVIGMTDEDQAMFKNDRSELLEVISNATDEEIVVISVAEVIEAEEVIAVDNA